MAVGCGAEIGARDDSEIGVTGLEPGASSAAVSGAFFSSCGGWSVVECFPVVHGGMERNSSKVRTRGLQHFQPDGSRISSCWCFENYVPILAVYGEARTFLAFMKDGWTGMIDTFLLRVCIRFAA